MLRTFQIDDSSQEAKELIARLNSLSYVKEVEGQNELSNKRLRIISETIDEIAADRKTYTWDEVKESLGLWKHK